MDAFFEWFSIERVVVELLLLIGLAMLLLPILRAQLMRMRFVPRSRAPIGNALSIAQVTPEAASGPSTGGKVFEELHARELGSGNLGSGNLDSDNLDSDNLDSDNLAGGDQGADARSSQNSGENPAGKATKQRYPVKYVAGHHSHSLLRLIPWDASGTLEATEHELHFVGSSPLGHPYDLSFDPDQALVNYQRGSLLWDGGMTWCVIEVNDEKHYFSSEVPARTVEKEFSGPNSTDALYRSLTNRYIKSSGS